MKADMAPYKKRIRNDAEKRFTHSRQGEVRSWLADRADRSCPRLGYTEGLKTTRDGAFLLRCDARRAGCGTGPWRSVMRKKKKKKKQFVVVARNCGPSFGTNGVISRGTASSQPPYLDPTLLTTIQPEFTNILFHTQSTA
jgi:hypothetical protein